MEKLNILINAYAVSPTWGSEPGMGWNWVINLANYCKVHVITEGEWKNEIEKAISGLPQKENLKFYYIPVSDNIRNMCWNQGDWRFYWYYRKWQKRAYYKSLDIIRNNNIDIIHQLNMIGFREPGYLWKIKEIPFVWGPVGGMGSVPINYLTGISFGRKSFFRLKNFISAMQVRFSHRVRAAVKRGCMLAATKEVQDKISHIYGINIPIENETGCSLSDISIKDKRIEQEKPLRLLWVGRFITTKKLDLALKTVAALKDINIELTICGTGSVEEVTRYQALSENLGIIDKIHWEGKIEHSRIFEYMHSSDLFFFTSIMEATSTVVLESIQCELPILCFNTCGFGPIVKDFAGITVEISNPDQAVADFAKEIKRIYDDREILNRISDQIVAKRDCLTWDSKAVKTIQLYHNCINR